MSQEFLKISYVNFFNYFKLFLLFDASASLIKGRDQLIILQFYKVFTALNDLNTTDSFEEKKSRFNSEFKILREKLHSYLTNNGNEKINLTCGNLDSKKQLKNCMLSMKFFSEKDKNSFEEYLKNQN